MRKECIDKNLEHYADYFEALFFADVNCDSDIENYAELDFRDINEESLVKQIKQLDEFFEKADHILENTDYDHGQACHDFFFTRNGHGVGFWENDHCNEEQGKALTEIAQSFGETYTYENDGQLYID